MRLAMKRAAVGSIAVAVILLAVAVIAEAQQPKKVVRIGILAAPSRAYFAARIKAFQEGLRDLGYIEGVNVSFESRFADGELERLPELAAELVSLRVDVVMTASEPAIRAAKDATSTIPIVFAAASDPVQTGLVASLARP